jgi:hypothetical protein
MTAYNGIQDAKQKIGNLAVYETEDIGNEMFRTPRLEMALGKATDLGARMVEKGATEEELIRLLHYRFTILANADKRHMDYKMAYKENNIKELEQKYINL